METLSATLPDSVVILNIEGVHETIDMPHGNQETDYLANVPISMISKVIRFVWGADYAFQISAINLIRQMEKFYT